MSDFNTMYEVLLRRKNKVLMPKFCVDNLKDYSSYDIINMHHGKETQYNNEYSRILFSALVNLNHLGYTISEDLAKMFLCFETQTQLKEYLSLLINNLKTLTGADKTYNPMYKNFPEDVMSISDFELYFNQLVHYLFNGTVYPIQHYEYFSDVEKIPLQDKTNLVTLTLGDVKDYENIFVNMMKSPTSISNQDKSDLMNFLGTYTNAMELIPETIPFKENMVFITSYIFNNIPNSKIALQKLLKTPTDILRFITLESGGDVTLTNKTKYINFNRHKRKILLSLLDRCKNLEEDMYRYKNEWIRLGEILHPSEYSKKYPKVVSAFYLIRNGYKIETFNSKLECMFKESKFFEAIELLKTRPGEFARKLDFIIRNVDEHDITQVLNAFKSVSTKIPSTILMNLKEHFIRRIQVIEKRIVFSKGNISNVYLVDKQLDSLNINVCKTIIKICEDALIAIYTTRDLMGNVYIDPNLRNHIVPFSQRSSSDMKNIITRGSRINVNNNTNYIRAFTWWTNQEHNGRVDIDLSVTLLDSDFNYVTHCSWTNLRDSKYNLYHSGDITNGGSVNGDGVAEFLDIDVETLKQENIEYVMFTVHNYTGQKFSELINCDFGFMERQNIKSGEIFEPKTVKNRMRINSDSLDITPVIYSVRNNQFIWIDTNIKISRGGWHTIESTMSSGAMTLYGIINMERANMYDVALYNTYARGFIVDNKEDADIIFLSENLSEEDQFLINDVEHPRRVITCYDIDEWYNLL